MEGFQNWAEKALNWPMYTRRYRYQKGTASFYVTGTSTSKSGTGTTVPFFIFILFIYFCLYFFSYSFFFLEQQCQYTNIPFSNALHLGFH